MVLIWTILFAWTSTPLAAKTDYKVSSTEEIRLRVAELLPGDTLTIADGNYDSLTVDLASSGSVELPVLVRPESRTGVPGSLADPRRDCEVKVLGTINMLEASRKAGVRKFVFASSNAPLGRQQPPANGPEAPPQYPPATPARRTGYPRNGQQMASS